MDRRIDLLRMIYVIALLLAMGLSGTAHAAAAKRADVTRSLGPHFFVDNAEKGGEDVMAKQPNKLLVRLDFSEKKPLHVGPGGTTITITGIGWASPNFKTQLPTELEITLRYLGADGEPGKDDVVIGTTTASFDFVNAGEYALKFDEPMTAVVDGKKPFFRLEIAPKNAAGDAVFRVKKDKESPKISVAGISKAIAE